MPYIPLLQAINAPDAPRVLFPGATGDFALSDRVANLTGATVDFLICCSLVDWTPAAIQTLIAKHEAAPAGNQGVIFRINTSGFPEMTGSQNGTSSSVGAATVAPAVLDLAAIWLWASRTTSTGQTDIYWAPYSLNEPAAWTNLSLNRATGAGQIFATAAAWSIGRTADGTTQMNGSVYRAIVRDAGVTVLDFNPLDAGGRSSWVSSGAGGETWTLQGAAAAYMPAMPDGAYWGVRAA